MKTTSSLQTIQAAQVASNPISALFAPFRRIKSRLLAMWHGEEAIATPEPSKITENNGATKVIKDMKISKASEVPDLPEHPEKPACLETVENRKDKSEAKDSLKHNDSLENDDGEDKDEEIEIYKEDGGDIDEDEEEMIDEKDVDENDTEYILLKDFVVNNVLVKDKDPWDDHFDHMDLAVRLVKSVEQQKTFFPVPIDVLCLASYIYSKIQEMDVDEYETMMCYRRRLRQAMRLRYAQDKKKYFPATWAADRLADFIDTLRDCSRNSATNAKPASKEATR